MIESILYQVMGYHNFFEYFSHLLLFGSFSLFFGGLLGLFCGFLCCRLFRSSRCLLSFSLFSGSSNLFWNGDFLDSVSESINNCLTSTINLVFDIQFLWFIQFLS